jgi:FkbM family methyltransferase
MLHQFFNDEYTRANSDMIEQMNCEGPYFLEDHIVGKGQVAIDAGAYIGDWAALASHMGAKVYAFEPSPKPMPILKDTARLNNFEVIPKGLGEFSNETLKLALQHSAGDMISENGDISCPMTSIDAFAEETNAFIAFIKSDVEGHERYLLRGATDVLKTQEPILAIRTYHYPEDRELLPKIVLKANPDYKITLTNHTMFAKVSR